MIVDGPGQDHPLEYLAPFVDRELKSQYQAEAADEARRYFGDDRTVGTKPVTEWDVAALPADVEAVST